MFCNFLIGKNNSLNKEMTTVTNDKYNHDGLTDQQVNELTLKFGKNILIPKKKEGLFGKIIHVLSEPMFILLIVAAAIYFILGEPKDGAIMLISVIGILSIEIFQEWKTDKTLNALKDLSAPKIKVIRNKAETTIRSDDLVPGDVMIIEEGVKIPADGKIITVNELCVDESSLTGEAEGVWKAIDSKTETGKDYWRKDYIYAGTLAINGRALVLVEKTGGNTEYGKIGIDVAAAPEDPTPLQNQTSELVKLCAGIAAVLFALVSAVTFFNISDHAIRPRIIESILSGVTLAMSMIPEEFPVILTVFLSMGAWRLAKKHSLVRRLPAVETLGAISVLCVDKTGTITMNKMTVQDTWTNDTDTKHLAEIMGLSCETDAYDPMEKAMSEHCESLGLSRGHLYSGELLLEYPFTHESKMMGHVWKHEGKVIVAAKGSPESILTLCKIPDNLIKTAHEKMEEMSRKGLRVIAIAEMKSKDRDSIPEKLADCTLTLCGLVGLADPPRDTIKDNIRQCVEAGIRVVMITGDNGITASAIAKQIQMPNADNILTGSELDKLSDDELCEKVKVINIFARVIPEHKMRIVKAFRENGEIVAMTGDGVNDAPALKYADIGIAMGKRGSGVSREAADIILLDDNFSTIVETIKDGRRIYDNIRRAIGYVLTIHVPIAFSTLLAPILGINPAALMLLPIHIVLLELVIDPTCSLVLERQPAEEDIMQRKPRNPREKILNAGTLIKSLLQGLIIFIAAFGTYFFFLNMDPDNAPVARAMGLIILLLANLFLVIVNSSDNAYAFRSIRHLIKDNVIRMIIFATISGILVFLYTPVSGFLRVAPLSLLQVIFAVIIAIVSVFWYEGIKFLKKSNDNIELSNKAK